MTSSRKSFTRRDYQEQLRHRVFYKRTLENMKKVRDGFYGASNSFAYAQIGSVFLGRWNKQDQVLVLCFGVYLSRLRRLLLVGRLLCGAFRAARRMQQRNSHGAECEYEVT